MLKVIDFVLFASPREICFATPVYGCSNSLILQISSSAAS